MCENVVSYAIKVGYKHVNCFCPLPGLVLTANEVDSAFIYGNEEPCAIAIMKSGIPRSEVFFTSKIPPRQLGYGKTKAQVDATLKLTGFDYVDLFLIHAPFGGREDRKGAWKALLEAQDAGKVRSIGVSNYGVHHLDEMEVYMKELEEERGKGKGGAIDVGQWEIHPWLARPDIVEWCQKRNIVIEAYCPIVRGERMGEKILEPLTKKYGKTGAQVLLRWSIQKGFVPLPKSETPSRIEENADIYDFELTEQEMESLNTGEYAPCAWDPTVATLDK